MDQILEFFSRLRDVKALVAWGGYVGLTAIIFAETGLLVGFFLPGDSLLVTAGLLASQDRFGLDILLLGLLLTAASILGNTVGYLIGRASGPRLFRREESLLFKPRYLRQAADFYERHGGKTIVIARFMPIVRTFVPVVAGAAGMSQRRYTFYNVVGGVLWIWSMLLTGYFLGRYIPGIDSHIEKVIVVVIALSLLPGLIHWLKARRQGAISG
ncbi:MAG TPA: VTT domain-containing protein [Gemmatimonadaceae bacterium]|nr:VTT domain-containing protein [Gemmatimonadaceae bacterium]